MTRDEMVAHAVGEIKRAMIDLEIGPDCGGPGISAAKELEREKKIWSEAESAIAKIVGMALDTKDAPPLFIGVPVYTKASPEVWRYDTENPFRPEPETRP